MPIPVPMPRSAGLALRGGLAAVLCACWLAPATAEAVAGAGASEKAPASAKPAKPAKPTPAKAPAARASSRKPALAPPAATPEQLDAAERVFYGLHRCEFAQSVDVAIDPELPGYVRVKFGKLTYVTKPVLSSTGAIRLEDVEGETLMVQIITKSMLLNVKAGHRLVDECVSARHHEAMEAARLGEVAASAAASAAAAAAAASAPAVDQ